MHNPATPLPWVEALTGQIGTSVFDGAGRVVASTDTHRYTAGEREIQDATYIAHAANAYPRLIEALRDALTLIYSAGDLADHAEYARGDALLRLLGEL